MMIETNSSASVKINIHIDEKRQRGRGMIFAEIRRNFV